MKSLGNRKVGYLLCGMILVAAIGVLVASVGCAPYVAPGEERAAATEQTGGFECGHPCKLFQVVWTGDSMLGDHGKAVLAREGLDFPLRKVKVLLEDAFAIGNAEGPITTHRKKFDKRQIWSYRTRPEVAKVFERPALTGWGWRITMRWTAGPLDCRTP